MPYYRRRSYGYRRPYYRRRRSYGGYGGYRRRYYGSKSYRRPYYRRRYYKKRMSYRGPDYEIEPRHVNRGTLYKPTNVFATNFALDATGGLEDPRVIDPASVNYMHDPYPPIQPVFLQEDEDAD